MRSPLALVILLGACDIGVNGQADLPIDAPPLIDAYVCDPR